MTKKKSNQLAIRSKDLLTEAFFALLKENPHKRIQVKDLCERAKISRPTFYAHYGTVEDILREYLDESLECIFDEIRPSLELEVPPEKQMLDASICYYRFWGEHVDLFKEIQAAGMENIIIENIKKNTLFNYQNFASKINKIEDVEIVEFLVSLLSNSSYHLISLWIKKGLQRSVEEMAETFLLMIPPKIMNSLAERFNK